MRITQKRHVHRVMPFMLSLVDGFPSSIFTTCNLSYRRRRRRLCERSSQFRVWSMSPSLIYLIRFLIGVAIASKGLKCRRMFSTRGLLPLCRLMVKFHCSQRKIVSHRLLESRLLVASASFMQPLGEKFTLQSRNRLGSGTELEKEGQGSKISLPC